MSAYVVPDATITILVRAGIRLGFIALPSASVVGQALKAENIRSVTARYPDTTLGGDMPGTASPADDPAGWRPVIDLIDNPHTPTRPPFGRLASIEYRYVKQWHDSALNLDAVLSVAGSYLYQACESPEWANSPVNGLLNQIAGKIVRLRHPQHADQAWEVTANMVRQAYSETLPRTPMTVQEACLDAIAYPVTA